MDTNLRFRELALSSFSTWTVASSTDSFDDLAISDIIDNVLSGSLMIVTGSPGFKCSSVTHFLGNDNTYVDFPVNCILLTSPLSEYIGNS